MSLCFLNSLPNGKYSNVMIVTAFSNNPFSGKTSATAKNSYLPTLSYDKAEILVLCLSKCIELCLA